jgi:hypothetical protein
VLSLVIPAPSFLFFDSVGETIREREREREREKDDDVNNKNSDEDNRNL